MNLRGSIAAITLTGNFRRGVDVNGGKDPLRALGTSVYFQLIRSICNEIGGDEVMWSLERLTQSLATRC